MQNILDALFGKTDRRTPIEKRAEELYYRLWKESDALQEQIDALEARKEAVDEKMEKAWDVLCRIQDKQWEAVGL